MIPQRHCEEPFATKQSSFLLCFHRREDGLLRCARNDVDRSRLNATFAAVAKEPHCAVMPELLTTAVSLSWSAFISAASSGRDIGLPGMSATES